MSDPRLTPANDRVAAEHLRGQIEAVAFSAGRARQVTAPIADLLRAPGGRRDRQLLMGDAVTVYEERDGFAFLQSGKDGYVGYVETGALGEVAVATHWVAVPRGHIYSAPDIKSPEIGALVFGNKVRTIAHQTGFHELAGGGYVCKPHLWPIDKQFSDPVTVAQMHFGVPYLWGGNSTQGLDCSGLVQAGMLACGMECPGDSDMQMALGEGFEGDYRRGDLLFWKGHVAMMVDAETLIHANAHHMAVAYEPVDRAVRRIEAQGDGPVVARRRLS